MIDGHTGEEDTFGSALRKSVRLAMNLQEHGIKPNDLILICTSSTVDGCIPIFASLYLGAKITIFEKEIPINEAVIMINEIDPVMMFISLDSIDFIEKLLKESNKCATVVVFGETNSYLNYFDMIGFLDGEDQFLPIAVEETQIAFIFFTSGSSAVPKAISYSHVGLLTLVGVSLDLNESFDMIMLLMSLGWITNLCYLVYSIIKGYCRLSLNNTDDLQLVWNVIDTYKPNFFCTVPNKLRHLCETVPHGASGESLKRVYIGGGSVGIHEWKNYKKIFRNAIVSSGYGVSEVGLLFYFPSSTEEELQCIESKPNSVGRVLNGISYKVVNVDTEELLGPYKNGELHVKPNIILSKYYRGNSNDVFEKDGWFKTGDLFYYDEDYYFYFVERIKNLIKYQHLWHVYPKVVEDFLRSRNEVSNACVFGIPCENEDEQTVAIVVLSPFYTAVDNIQYELCRYVEESLGVRYKLRGGIKIVDKIPLLPSGKPDIRKLRRDFIMSTKKT
ncbi:hypothetical protein FQR65_LT01962 [Abscondita terminalis]|nr:hypothetical protein FQR65_LT01962 [Abscondita terminalis]